MDTEKDKQKITIVLPIEIINKMKQEAERHQRSFNREIVWALQEYLDRQKREQKHASQQKDQA